MVASYILKEWNNVLRKRNILLLDLTQLSSAPAKGCLFLRKLKKAAKIHLSAS
jgi:hypothetical protein